MTINCYDNRNLKPHCGRLWKGIRYGHPRCHDQIARCTGKTDLIRCSEGTSTILIEAFPPRFYTGSVGCNSGSQTVFWDRLPGYCRVPQRPQRLTQGIEAQKSATFHHHPEGSAEASKKRAWHKLLARIFAVAKTYGLIDDSPEASIDSTGLESRLVSRHFLVRQGKRTKRYRKWTKLTVVCHNPSHLIASAVVSLGPSNDSAYLPAAVTEAVENLSIGRLLADAGYDAEANHRLCREELGIRSTVIAVNARGCKTGEITGRYRNQMYKRFPKRKYHQRWQIESVISRMKRRLGYALRARDEQSRRNECLFRVLTYNLMILYLLLEKSLRSLSVALLH